MLTHYGVLHLHTIVLTLASYSSILWVAIGTGDSGVTWTVNESTFTTTASNIVQVNWTNASTKMSTAEGHCTCLSKDCLNSVACKLMQATKPWVEYPSCRHTTVASELPQESSHTVPHSLSMHTSTLPSFARLRPTSRSWPLVHGACI